MCYLGGIPSTERHSCFWVRMALFNEIGIPINLHGKEAKRVKNPTTLRARSLYRWPIVVARITHIYLSIISEEDWGQIMTGIYTRDKYHKHDGWQGCVCYYKEWMTDLTSSRSFAMMTNQKVKLPLMFFPSPEFTRQVKFRLKSEKIRCHFV